MKRETARSITIDALPLLFEGGISNYTRPLVENLFKYTGSRWRVDLLFRMGISKARVKQYQHYKELSELENCSHHLIWFPDRLLMGLWEYGIFVPFMRNRKGDIFIATTELVPKRNNANVGWIVYDLTQLRIPQFFPTNRDIFLSSVAKKLKKTDFVITISECTKRDVQLLMQYPEEKICVIYPGVTPYRNSCEATSNAGSPSRPYILYLGALAFNKNVDGMLRIFSLCVNEHRLDMDIILTGKDFCGRSFWQRIIQDLKIEGRVHMTGWISDADREHLLAHATMLWQFSWYEGFGLPVLEAASRGVPVLYTNRGAVPEILKNPEQEIDPADEETTASRAAQALRSQETLERWKRLGVARASEFSWEKSAQKLLGWMEERL